MHQVGGLHRAVHRAHPYWFPEKRLEADSVQMECDEGAVGNIREELIAFEFELSLRGSV